jgi:arylsulfatase A-like enzyme
MPGLIDRRAFLAASGCAFAGVAQPPRVVYIVATRRMDIPKRIVAEGVVFTRAYVASPDTGAWDRALASGIYPHALPPDAAHDPGSIGLKGHWLEVASATDADRVLAELDASGAAADSAVVFTHRPAASGWDEQFTRLPLAIRIPNLLTGGKAHGFLVSTVDVTPTLASLLGIALPHPVQGQDLSAILRTGHGAHPESIYAEGDLRRPDEWRMVVRGLDKLVVAPNLKVQHLFNLGEDPDEKHDLTQEPGHQLKVDELLAFAQLWMRQTSDGMDPSGLRRR